MALAKGINSFVGTAPETTWGTAVGATGYNRFVSQSFLPESDETPGDRSLGKAFRSGVDVYRKRTEGDIVFDMKYQGYERWLYNLFGAVTTTTYETTGRKHVFSLSATRPVGMSLELHLGIFKSVIAGLKLNRMDLSMGVGILQATFGGVGKAIATPQGSVEASPTFLEDASSRIKPIKALGNAPGGAPGDDGNGFSLQVGTAGTFASPATYCSAEPATISVNAPLKTDDICLGDPGLVEPTLDDIFQISGGFPRQLIDDDFLEFFLADNPVYMRFRYDGNDTVIDAGTQHFVAHVDIPYARIKKALGPVSGAGGIVENVEYVADPPSGTAADAITFTIYNLLASVT